MTKIALLSDDIAICKYFKYKSAFDNILNMLARYYLKWHEIQIGKITF